MNADLLMETKIKGIYGLYISGLNNGHFIAYDKVNFIIFHKNLIIEKQKSDIQNASIVKQLRNGQVICAFKKLFVYSLIKYKMMLSKIIDIPNLYEEEYLIDLIELKNGDIIIFTEFKILKIKLGDNTDEISQIYEIPKSFLYNKGKKYLYFKKGLNIYELGNNNILIHSQMIYPIDNYRNKMIIFNLDNCQIVKYKIFQKPAFAII